jgi:hypothetical protein
MYESVGERGPTQWQLGWLGRWVLWAPFVLAALGDTVTTWYGLTHAGLMEANPLVSELARSFGLVPAMVALKTGMLAVFGVAYRHVAPEVRWAVPVLGAVVQLSVVVVNLAGIVGG